MSSLVRMVEFCEARRSGMETQETLSGSQLSLFDFRPKIAFHFMRMKTLHGAVFRNALTSVRPELSVDFRAYPYFDLLQLNPHEAFATIDRVSRSYIEIPTDFRRLRGRCDRWTMVGEIQERLRTVSTWVDNEVASERLCTAVAVFVNDEDDADLLERAIAQTDRERATKWVCHHTA